DEAARTYPAVIEQTILDTPSGRKVALGQVAQVIRGRGPNTLNREHVERRIVVSCNVSPRRGLGEVVGEIQQALRPLERKLAAKQGNYRIEYGGQFEAQQQATGRLFLLGSLAVVGVFLLLWKCLGSWRAAAQVLLVNIPLAAVGSVVALM